MCKHQKRSNDDHSRATRHRASARGDARPRPRRPRAAGPPQDGPLGDHLDARRPPPGPPPVGGPERAAPAARSVTVRGLVTAQTFTRELWSGIEGTYAAILRHPFVAGLTDGS